MTSSPPEVETTDGEQAGEEEVAETRHPLADYADQVAAAVGGTAQITFDTVKVSVDPGQWVAALTTARDDLDLVLFSFLSVIDWSNEPAVGDPLTEELSEESFEVLAMVGDVTVGRSVAFSTRLGRQDPAIDSLVGVYAGANWHEREAHEMFGLDFVGHPDLSHLYLPDGFIGNPLLKSFPLLSREVKPWPGKVDVEGMPETEEEAAEEEPAEEAPEGEAAEEEPAEGEATEEAGE